MASHRAYQLADAVADMALRIAEAERRRAGASTRFVYTSNPAAEAECAHWERLAGWRHKALWRLTAALRDLTVR